MQCSELQKDILDTHLCLLLISRLSRVTRVLYQLTRFTENITMFAQLSLQADLQLFLNPPLLTCLVNENRAGKSHSAGGPQEMCSCDLRFSDPFALSTIINKEVCKVKVGVKQPCEQNYICCLEDSCP